MWKYPWNKLNLVYRSLAAPVNLQRSSKLQWTQLAAAVFNALAYQRDGLCELSLNRALNHVNIHAESNSCVFLSSFG